MVELKAEQDKYQQKMEAGVKRVATLNRRFKNWAVLGDLRLILNTWKWIYEGTNDSRLEKQRENIAQIDDFLQTLDSSDKVPVENISPLVGLFKEIAKQFLAIIKPEGRILDE